MALTDEINREQLNDWLALLGGDGYRGVEARDRAVLEMRAVGANRLFPLLTEMLANSDPELRCKACEAILRVDKKSGLDLILPALTDAEHYVRWTACGLMFGFGDERVVDPLVERMKTDADPQVRGAAAYALGGIGSPSAIPALIDAVDIDHEVDRLGHSPSSCAAGALDDILGTNQTRIRLSEDLCKMSAVPADLAKLKQLAIERYRSWKH